MRYYEIRYPDGKENITTNIRRLRDLPDGTIIEAVVTERDGTVCDSWGIPVTNGRAQVSKRGKDKSKYWGL